MWSPTQTLVARFESCTLEYPDNTAVCDRGRCWSYAELNSAANRIAARLASSRDRSSEPVLLLLPPGPAFLAALLGTLKAGKFFVPLDPAFPFARNRFIVDDSQSGVILTSADQADQAQTLANGRAVLTVDETLEGPAAPNPGLPIPPDANAFLIYTSGSTGTPKGVLQTHANMLHNTWRQTVAMGFGPNDRLGALYSTSVMGQMRDVWNGLLNGAGLWPFDLRGQGVARLADWLVAEKITVLHTIASVFRHMEPTLPPPEALQALRLVILGGETVLATDFEIFRQHLAPHTRLYTGLGSTETGTVRALTLDRTCRIDQPILPLGYAVPGVDIELIDADGAPVAPGEVGEIVVVSAFLSPGYWNRPGLTEEAFARADGNRRRFRTSDLGRLAPDGCLLYAGRKDFQLKIRGFRVEAAEVEAAILRTGLVTDAVVVGHEARPGMTILVAYVACPDPALTGSLPPLMAQGLPDHMIPAVFVPLDALPLHPNGKVDRQALPAPILEGHIAPAEQPRDAVEADLAGIWRGLLALESVGIHDDFFELGGDSLAASLMALEIERRFGVQFPLSLFLEHRTVAQIAAWLRQHGEAPGCLIPIQPNGAAPPLFVIPGGYGNVLFLRHLAQYLGPDQPLFGLQSTGGASSLRHYYRDVAEVSGPYLEAIRRVQPDGPYRLAGYSFGGYVALEIAQRLLADGRQVGLLALLDTYPPGPRRGASTADRIRLHLRNLSHKPLTRWPAYAAARLRSLGLKATRLEAVRMVMRAVGYYPSQPMVASRIARYGYNPPPYPGPAVVLRARQREAYIRWDPMERWAAYVSGELTFVDVEGSHSNILHEPQVRQVAQELKRLLNRT